MFKTENAVLEMLRRSMVWIFLLAALLGAIVVRVHFIGAISHDMEVFLLPWYDEIVQGGGFTALYDHSGNYNFLYMLLLFFATRLPLPAIAAIKLFSFVGDALLALAAALIVAQLLPQSRYKKLFPPLTFVAVLLLPSVVLNSAYWGQCDALYTACLLFAVYFLLRSKWIFAFVMVGLALCFKLQAVFFLPALLLLYVSKRKFSILHFLVPPAMLFLSGAPEIIANQDLLAPFRVYTGQALSGDGAYVNYHNLSAIFPDTNQASFITPLMVLTILVFLGMLALVMLRRLHFSGDGILLLAAWSVMTCVVLLPKMHERYAFAGELLLLLWFAVRPSVRRGIPALTFYLIGLMACCRFLLGDIWPPQSIWLALLNIACWVYVTWLLVKAGAKQPRPQPTVAGAAQTPYN
ncbi:MAG: DUF2029 domain-containing protein [Ruminococcaceae bacterium]|nr:DUF2029 domain-containing protein [Oscillospiraceae bacterium]